jgi:hypothetical protein
MKMQLPDNRNRSRDQMQMFAQGLNMLNTFSDMSYNAQTRPLQLKSAEMDLEYKKELHAYRKLQMQADSDNIRQALVISGWNNQRYGFPPTEAQMEAIGEFLQTDPSTIDYNDEDGSMTFMKEHEGMSVPVTLTRDQVDQFVKASSKKVENYQEFQRVERNLEKVQSRYMSLDEETSKMGPETANEPPEIKKKRMAYRIEMDSLLKQQRDMMDIIQTFEPVVRPNIMEGREQAKKMADDEYFKLYGDPNEPLPEKQSWWDMLLGRKKPSEGASASSEEAGKRGIDMSKPSPETKASNGVDVSGAVAADPVQATPKAQAPSGGITSDNVDRGINSTGAGVELQPQAQRKGPLPNPTEGPKDNIPRLTVDQALKTLKPGQYFRDIETGKVGTVE